MPNVVTVIAPKDQPLDEKLINKLFIKIEKAGGSIFGLGWLAEGEACDILFDGLEVDKARSAVQPVSHEKNVDVIVQVSKHRHKKLLISDMDSTMIHQECIDEIADTLGLKEKVAVITEKAMNGELDFAKALKERVALLEGVTEKQLHQVYASKITLMDGAKTLVQTMAKYGARCVLVSGGFTFFTEKVVGALGFQEHYANTLLIENGALTGAVHEPILDKDSKLDILEQHRKDMAIDSDEILAVGDGANDLPMLLGAGLGIAYHAKPTVIERASHCIKFTDLTSLLYAQGIKKEEFC